jgi:tRNA threonylcarbamoyladenosine biosynthesis protein TsaB
VTSLTRVALEASTERLSIAASAGGRTLVWEVCPARTESERLFVHLERVLGELGTGLSALAAVAFGSGPGSFTGLRITAAAAQALAFALRIPVTRSSSLAIQAATAMRVTGADRVAVCNDARMGRAYWGLYARDGKGVRAEVEDCVVDPQLFRYDGPPGFLAVGSAWAACAGLQAAHKAAISELRDDLLPSAADLLDLSLLDLERKACIAPEEALPNYLGHGPVAAACLSPAPATGIRSSDTGEIPRT